MGAKPLRTLLILVIGFALLVGCNAAASQDDTDLSERVIRVMTTTGMIGDLAINIGGDRVDVTSLMGPGVDPHLYTASEGDVRRLGEADIIFYNGLDLEAHMVRVFDRMEDRTVAVSDDIDRAGLLSPPEFEGNYDPHIWFDVQLWIQAGARVRDALIERDPTHADTYRANAERYLAELEELHEYVLTQAEGVPAEKRVLITAHDAFNYFGRAYGFEVRGLQGISTVAEAGTADVQELANFIVERDIPAIFIETSVAPRPIEALQEAVRAQGNEVTIGGELFSDAMGNPDTPEGTYVGMVRHNIDTIVDALLRSGSPRG